MYISGDSLTSHDAREFSTRDYDWRSCSKWYKGGWWYHSCHSSNLNGLYLNGSHSSYADGVNWNTWRGNYNSLKTTEMKVRGQF